MKEKQTPLHKRMAMGDTVKGYAKGGSIGVSVPTASVVSKPTKTGGTMSPMEKAKRNNGVKGM